jgi:hypothetical protein
MFLDWLLFPGFCLFGFGPTLGGNKEQIKWESVPTRPFWSNLSNKEA